MTSPDKRNWGSKFKIWKSKVEVTGNENVKIDFRAHLRRHWIDLRQTKSEMINGPFYIYISAAEMLRFVRFVCLSVCLSVCRIPFVYSILERGRKFMFFGEVTAYASEWWCISKMDGRTDGRTDWQTNGVRTSHCITFYRILQDFYLPWNFSDAMCVVSRRIDAHACVQQPLASRG